MKRMEGGQSMGFFEEELRKMFGVNSPVSDTRFNGRACVGRLTEKINVKLNFETLGTHEKYEGIKATVYNRSEGTIDSSVFRFADILGMNVRKHNLNNDMPYVWASSRGNYEWYSYKPTTADYAAVAGEVNSYLEVFLEQQQPPKKSNILYLLYSCNEWCEKSKASLMLITSDKKTLYAAIGGEILTGSMEYLGESGGNGFAAYKKDYLSGNDVLCELKYGFIKEKYEALLSEPDTLPEYQSAASELLAADYHFNPAEFNKAYNSEDFEPDEENDMEI
jgi:hypothetical protein